MIQQRHQARIVALQGLYQLDIQRADNGTDVNVALEPLLIEAELADAPAQYALILASGVWSLRERYDQMMAEVSKHWDVSRMAVVDRNIIRLALHELIEHIDVPPRVVIDEAIELGREFGSAETPNFVNGVLDALLKQHPACRIARGEPDSNTK
jgi:N utilization substance protein B